MALSANRDVDHYIDQELRSFQVAASAHIFKGAFVGLSGGYARPLTAGDPWVGIAYEEMNNSSGADGDLSVRVYTTGDFGLTLSGATVSSIGRPVFASADDTLTFTGAGNSYVGIVQDVVATNEIILRIDPSRRQIKTVIHPVEDLSAGSDISTRGIHGFGTEGWIVAARIVNQATAASGIDDSNTCVVTVAVDGNTIVTETFDSTTTFPSANTAQDLGAVGNTQVNAGDVLTLAVTNGTNADPGPFLVLVDYV
ncbi:MAG: hypothetical protein JSU63_01805 [Phycisphaerales bacterium]|nr:MAG: hypothetical protein JSU63_01805 [Phycisphaerales bacterium]